MTERIQADLLRKMRPSQRLRLMSNLSSTALRLARRAIRREHPDASEEELLVEFVGVHYGRDLAERVRAQLAKRKK